MPNNMGNTQYINFIKQFKYLIKQSKTSIEFIPNMYFHLGEKYPKNYDQIFML